MNAGYRQLRGLVIHYRTRPRAVVESERKWGYSRSLIDRSTVVPSTIGQKFDGRCRWCRLAVPPKKRSWCGPGCLRAYAMALGLQKTPNGRFLLSTRQACCAHCGRGGRWHGPADAESRWNYYDLQIDHVLALSIAFFRPEGERLRAYTLGNLQWLCPECHKTKTADDRRRWLNLSAGRPEDWQPSFGDAFRVLPAPSQASSPLPLFQGDA